MTVAAGQALWNKIWAKGIKVTFMITGYIRTKITMEAKEGAISFLRKADPENI
jgi:hypothetical protein